MSVENPSIDGILKKLFFKKKKKSKRLKKDCRLMLQILKKIAAYRLKREDAPSSEEFIAFVESKMMKLVESNRKHFDDLVSELEMMFTGFPTNPKSIEFKDCQIQMGGNNTIAINGQEIPQSQETDPPSQPTTETVRKQYVDDPNLPELQIPIPCSEEVSEARDLETDSGVDSMSEGDESDTSGYELPESDTSDDELPESDTSDDKLPEAGTNDEELPKSVMTDDELPKSVYASDRGGFALPFENRNIVKDYSLKQSALRFTDCALDENYYADNLINVGYQKEARINPEFTMDDIDEGGNVVDSREQKSVPIQNQDTFIPENLLQDTTVNSSVISLSNESPEKESVKVNRLNKSGSELQKYVFRDRGKFLNSIPRSPGLSGTRSKSFQQHIRRADVSAGEDNAGTQSSVGNLSSAKQKLRTACSPFRTTFLHETGGPDRRNDLSPTTDSLEDFGRSKTTGSVEGFHHSETTGSREDFGRSKTTGSIEDFGRSKITGSIEDFGRSKTTGPIEDFGRSKTTGPIEDFGRSKTTGPIEDFGRSKTTGSGEVFGRSIATGSGEDFSRFKATGFVKDFGNSKATDFEEFGHFKTNGLVEDFGSSQTTGSVEDFDRIRASGSLRDFFDAEGMGYFGHRIFPQSVDFAVQPEDELPLLKLMTLQRLMTRIRVPEKSIKRLTSK